MRCDIKYKLIILSVEVGFFFISFPVYVLAADVAPRISARMSDREIVEGLADVRGDIKGLEQRFDATDKRLDAIERQMNRRFDDIKWFLGIMIGALLIINTGVLGYVLKRQGSGEKSLETVKDEIIFLKGIIEKLLPPKSAL